MHGMNVKKIAPTCLCHSWPSSVEQYIHHLMPFLVRFVLYCELCRIYCNKY